LFERGPSTLNPKKDECCNRRAASGIDAAADGVGGLAIGEVLAELHDGGQGELAGGQCGLPAPGVEVGEVGVAEDGSELVTEPEVGVALGEGGAGDAGGQLGDVRDGAGLQGHGCTSWRGMSWYNPFQYSGLPPCREFANSISNGTGNWNNSVGVYADQSGGIHGFY
jgi:hypothetical protein